MIIRLQRHPGTCALIALSLLGCLLTAGCGGGRKGRRDRTAGSAIWLASDSAEVTAAALRTLAESGAPEVFVHAATIGWQEGELEFERVSELDPPSRTPLTLAISGAGPQSGNPSDQAESLADPLLQLKLDAETRGWPLEGFHLDLDVSEVEHVAEFLAALRRRIDRSLALSLRLPETWLALETKQLEPILETIDFYTLRVYGQTMTQQRDRPDLWEVEKAIALAERATRIGKPFLAEAATIGWVVRIGADGEERDRAYGVPLRALLTNRSFEVEPVFSFSGFDRQVFELAASRTGRLGGLRVRAGERLRVVRPTAAHLARLHSGLAGLGSEILLGELFRAWPSELQSLSVDSRALARALQGKTAPELQILAERLSESPYTEMRFEIHNPDVVTTSVALRESNYLEIEIDQASFGAVETGDFKRYSLGRRGDSDDVIQSVRNANRLRLYFPMMEPGWTISTGTIHFHTDKSSEIRVGANFMLPDGQVATIEPRAWQTFVASEAADESPADQGRGRGEAEGRP